MTTPRCVVVDLSPRRREEFETFGIPPTWRSLHAWLATARVQAAVWTLDEAIRRFRADDSTPLFVLVHLDDYLPDHAAPFLQSLHDARPGSTLVACGYLPTVRPREVLAALPALSGVVRGPVEFMVRELARCAAGALAPATMANFESADRAAAAYTAPRSTEEDLLTGASIGEADEPDTSGFRNGVATLYGSIGCPHRCGFCRRSAFYRAWAQKGYMLRPVEAIADEIQRLSERAGIRHVRFNDLNFLGNARLADRRATAFADALRARRCEVTFEFHSRADSVTEAVLSVLVPVGLRHLALGVESMSPTQLARYEKDETVEDHLRAFALIAGHGLRSQAYAMLADPLATRDELAESLEGLLLVNRSALVIIHERMTLYESGGYHARYGRLLETRPSRPSLGAVLEYDFVDPWMRRFLPVLEDVSHRFRTAVRQRWVRQGGGVDTPEVHDYVRAATDDLLRVLSKLVACDEPDREEALGWLDSHSSIFRSSPCAGVKRSY